MGMDIKIFPIRTLNFLRPLPQGTTNAISLAPGTCSLKDSSLFPPPAASSPSPTRPQVLPVLVHVVCTFRLSSWRALGSLGPLTPVHSAGEHNGLPWSQPSRAMAGHKARCAPLHVGDCTRASQGPAGSAEDLRRAGCFRALGLFRSSSGHSCPPSPPCTLIAPWAGGERGRGHA